MLTEAYNEMKIVMAKYQRIRYHYKKQNDELGDYNKRKAAIKKAYRERNKEKINERARLKYQEEKDKFKAKYQETKQKLEKLERLEKLEEEFKRLSATVL
jgi:type I site-specific restriction-modification system R (restriction) subunit